MELLPLPIFPQGSLAASVITTVWIGVLVVSWFNLRLGWTFSGLVVPGYLVPLLIAKPWAAVAVMAEGLLCYLLVRLASELPAGGGAWCSFFGRDRFFALLLGSVAVRVASDGWLLPALGETLNQKYGLAFDYRNNLHSFGLIIVALIANLLWKPGAARGLGALAVTVGTTYLLVRYGLMELTNFNIGNLRYLYEDFAASLLASPKAYIVLLTAAFLASHMNLRYGWEFNGILIPALLALQWSQPLKVLSSFAEAGVVYLLASLALRTPWLRESSVEGARKLALFFSVSFVYKLLLGHLMLALRPELKVTDFYGFGYLLSTLMALKAHDKEIAARLTRGTLQVSLVAMAAASLVGFSLTFLPRFWSRPAQAAAVAPPRVPPGSLGELLRADKVRLYEKRVPDSVAVPLPAELDAFTEGVRALLAHVRTRDPEALRRGRAHLEGVQYRVEEVERRYLYLREAAPSPRGWGLYVLDRERPEGVLVEVPAPLDEWGTLESGSTLFHALEGGALAVAGAGRRTNHDGSADVLLEPRTAFHAFHRVLARRNVLQVRGQSAETVRVLGGLRQSETQLELPQIESGLWVKSALPPGLDLARLKGLIGGYEITWRPAPFANRQRDATRSGFAELFLNRADARALLVRSVLDLAKLAPQLHLQRIDGYLQDWLLTRKGRIAEPASDLYRPPSREELLFLDGEVVTPLLELAATGYADGAFESAALDELRAVAAAAAVFDYELVWYRHRPTAQDYVILAEDDAAPRRRYWGTYVLRLGAARPYLVQVPRPLFERSSFEYAVALFERLEASLLLIAGAHPGANRDGSADLVQSENIASLFNVANQAALRAAGDAAAMVVQSRALGLREGGELPAADLVLASADGATRPTALGPLGLELLSSLKRDGLSVRFADGSGDTVGYEAGGLPQARYLSQTANKEFVILWVSPLIRAAYRLQTENALQAAQFKALGIPTREADLAEDLLAHGRRQGFGPVEPELRSLVDRYRASHDVVVLEAIARGWPGLRLERIIDRNSKQSFLVIHGSPARWPLVANLVALPSAATEVVRGATAEDVRRFVDSRAGWLERGES